MHAWTKKISLAAVFIWVITTPMLAMAQAWPTRQPIRLVAVFPPGGSVDQVARIIAQPLSQQLGQTVIVENRGGASGTIGTAAVVQAPADGYTFAVVFDTHGVNPALMPKLSYNPLRDLAPVSIVGSFPLVLAVREDFPARNIKDLSTAFESL